jgi:uncharacterized protein DUF5678
MVATLNTIPTKCCIQPGLRYTNRRGATYVRDKHTSTPRYDIHLNRRAVKNARWHFTRVRYNRVDPLADLRRAAQRLNEGEFITALRKVDWQRQSENVFIRAIQLALGVGAYTTITAIADEGTRMHPHSDALRKYSSVLAPPRIVTRIPANPGLRATREWLRSNAQQYRGKWVAVRDGHLLAAGDSFDDLARQPENRGALITLIN